MNQKIANDDGLKSLYNEKNSILSSEKVSSDLEDVKKNQKYSKRKVPSLLEREKNISRKFSGFSVRISKDEIGKKKLSNRVTITFPDSRSESTIKMTLREAKSLLLFLKKQLDNK